MNALVSDPIVLAEIRKLSAAKKIARDKYHRCLATSAPDHERHAAEKECSTAAKAMEVFIKSI